MTDSLNDMTTDTQATQLLPCELHKLFKYDSATGQLTWMKYGRGHKTGKPVGSKDSKGRLRCEIGGNTYSVSHIVFAMHTGRWPVQQIDHINQVKTDDRIENLREATNAQNSCNRKSKNELGKGISFHKGYYIARLMSKGKSIHLGSFSNQDDALSAYQNAAMKYHGEFACPSN